MSKSVLLAGILGGILGGAASFALTRALPSAAKQELLPGQSPSSDARTVADSFIAKLQAGRYDEFATDLRPGLTDMSDAQFAEFKKDLIETRKILMKVYGQPTGEFELLREQPIGSSLVRLAYLEKFPSGGVVWFFVLYNSPTGWRVSGLSYEKLESAFTVLR